MLYKLTSVYFFFILLFLRIYGSRQVKGLVTSHLIQTVNDANTDLKTNLVFIKTHKTGSTTVSGILTRFSLENNLTCVLGNGKWTRYFIAEPISEDGIPLNIVPTLDGKYNMLYNHLRYSKHIKRLFYRHTYFITILREPVSNFASYFYYQGYTKRFCLETEDDPIAAFSKNARFYFRYGCRFKANRGLGLLKPNAHVGNIPNPMMYDLGISEETLASEDKMNAAIRDIEREFDLVMIMEYFDESLILLKNLMNWSFDNIVYFKMRERTNSRNVDKLTAERLLKLNQGDVALYSYFNITFWKRVEKFSICRMNQELELFHKRQEYWYSFCVGSKVKSNGKSDISHFEYRLKPNAENNLMCQRLSVFHRFLLQDVYQNMYNQGKVVSQKPKYLVK